MEDAGPNTRVAIVGVGKIARDEHMPTIAADPRFTLVATVTRHNVLSDVPNFATLAALKQAHPDVTAIAICTPPRGRLELVREAVDLGLDVLLEKPPAATVSEAEGLIAAARGSDSVLYITWHSREAAGVMPAHAWLRGKSIRRTTVTWAEDVRVWHPGQEWIWEPGIGVFDPGINALSILTAILPGPIMLDRATLFFPENRSAPIAAELKLSDAGGAPVAVELDFDRRGPQAWTITVETDGGTLTLSDGGARLAIDGAPVEVPDMPEYARLYSHFANLIRTRCSDIDLSPFRLVADAFLLGERRTAAQFDWNV